MFSRFHVCIVPGGPHLGTVQAEILRNVVRQHGGVVESDVLSLPGVAVSLARRGQKKLVIVSGRDSVDQAEGDLLQLCVAASLRSKAGAPATAVDVASQAAASVIHRLRAAMVTTATTPAGNRAALQHLSSAAAPVAADPATLLPTVICASPLWISTSVSKQLSTSPSSSSSAPGGPSAQTLALLASFRLTSGGALDRQDSVNSTGLGEDGADSDCKRGIAQHDRQGALTAKETIPATSGRAAGFIPVFFSNRPPALNDDGDGDNGPGEGVTTRHRNREGLIQELHRQGKSAAVANEGQGTPHGKRARSVSPPENDLHRFPNRPSRRHQDDNRRDGAEHDGPVWSAMAAGSEFQVTEAPHRKDGSTLDAKDEGLSGVVAVGSSARSRLVIDPNDRSLARQAAFIDLVKPFVCQQQAPSRSVGSVGPPPPIAPSLFDDDTDSNCSDDLSPVDRDGGGHGAATLRQVTGSGSTATHQAFQFPPQAPEAPRVALNQPLLTQLAELKSVYEATGDQWRMYAYNKAIGIIKRLPFQVQRVEQLASYQGLGQRILNKVREILNTGTTTKLHVLRTTPHVAAMEAFSKIWGVGPSTARRLSTLSTTSLSTTTTIGSAGAEVVPTSLRTIEDLRACSELEHLLNQQQMVGLRHYEDLDERMPRDEVTALVHFVERALKAVVGERRAAHIDVVACGSYRRRKATSGDVDILLCDRNTEGGTDGLLGRLVQHLKMPFATVSMGPTDKKAGTKLGALIDEADPLKMKGGSPTVSGCGVQCRCSRRRHAFIVEDLTVSHRGLQEVHSDSWFGVVQLPDCISGNIRAASHQADDSKVAHAAVPPHAPPCPCVHRRSGAVSLDDHAGQISTQQQQPSLGEAYQCGAHYSRRMDIKLYPPEQFAFALLYFTGSDYFNRSMRLFCQKRGWSLSDKDLKPVVRVHGEKVHETAHGIPCKTERDIFEAIGLPYKEPWERDV